MKDKTLSAFVNRIIKADKNTARIANEVMCAFKMGYDEGLKENENK